MGGSEVLVVESYADLQFGRYEKSDVSATLRVKEPYGGGEALVLQTVHNDTLATQNEEKRQRSESCDT